MTAINSVKRKTSEDFKKFNFARDSEFYLGQIFQQRSNSGEWGGMTWRLQPQGPPQQPTQNSFSFFPFFLLCSLKNQLNCTNSQDNFYNLTLSPNTEDWRLMFSSFQCGLYWVLKWARRTKSTVLISIHHHLSETWGWGLSRCRLAPQKIKCFLD